MRGHRHRLLTVGVLAGTAALVGAGFPANNAPAKEVSPEKWTRSVCTSLGDWAADLAAAQEDVDPSETDLDRKQDDLVAYLEEVTDATDALMKRLRKAGTPDVKNGKGVTGAFRKGFAQARHTFEDDVLEIQEAIRSGADDIAATFDKADEKYYVPELDEAFAAEPSCSGAA